MKDLVDLFVEALQNPIVRVAVLNYLRQKSPEHYAEARLLASNEEKWKEFLASDYIRSLEDFIDKSRENVIAKKNALEEMEEMISINTTTETEMRRFFKRHPWIISFEYQELREQKRAGEDNILDYRLRRVDGNFDIVEIKGPNDSLFVKQKERLSMTKKLSNSVLQIMRYVDYYDKHHDYVLAKEGQKTYKPTGILIMGRLKEEEREPLDMVNSFLVRIGITTYDDILQKAKNAITTLME